MSAALVRQALARAARSLGVRAESTAAAAAAAERPVPAAVQQQLAEALGQLPTSDPALQPYYEQLAQMEVVPSRDSRKASESEIAVRAAAGRGSGVGHLACTRQGLRAACSVCALRSGWSTVACTEPALGCPP